jgi:hypothetical protein
VCDSVARFFIPPSDAIGLLSAAAEIVAAVGLIDLGPFGFIVAGAGAVVHGIDLAEYIETG